MICKSLFQRQTFLKPMKVETFGMSLQGLLSWLTWNIGYLLYLLCTALPILFYIVCLFLMAVKREASITLSIIMVALINPLVSIPIGIFTKSVGQYFSKKLFRNQPSTTLTKIISRLVTYSLNFHLTLIAGLIYYLFAIWINLDESSDIDFNDEPYDLCTCDILTELGQLCTNRETDFSFQNRVIRFSIPLFLQIFILISISCHLVHSLVLYIPSPLTLIDFITGINHVDPSKSNNTMEKRQNEVSKKKSFKISCSFIAIVYIVGVISSPYYGFNLFLGHLPRNDNGISSLNLIDLWFLICDEISFQTQFV